MLINFPREEIFIFLNLSSSALTHKEEKKSLLVFALVFIVIFFSVHTINFEIEFMADVKTEIKKNIKQSAQYKI